MDRIIKKISKKSSTIYKKMSKHGAYVHNIPVSNFPISAPPSTHQAVANGSHFFHVVPQPRCPPIPGSSCHWQNKWKKARNNHRKRQESNINHIIQLYKLNFFKHLSQYPFGTLDQVITPRTHTLSQVSTPSSTCRDFEELKFCTRSLYGATFPS